MEYGLLLGREGHWRASARELLLACKTIRIVDFHNTKFFECLDTFLALSIPDHASQSSEDRAFIAGIHTSLARMKTQSSLRSDFTLPVAFRTQGHLYLSVVVMSVVRPQ